MTAVKIRVRRPRLPRERRGVERAPLCVHCPRSSAASRPLAALLYGRHNCVPLPHDAERREPQPVARPSGRSSQTLPSSTARRHPRQLNDDQVRLLGRRRRRWPQSACFPSLQNLLGRRPTPVSSGCRSSLLTTTAIGLNGSLTMASETASESSGASRT